MNALAAWPVWTPLAGAALAFMASGLLRRAVALVSAALTAAAAVALAWRVGTAGALRHRIGGWGAPLGIDLYADGLAATMVLTTAVSAGLVAVYALGYFAHESPDRREPFWPLLLFIWTSLNAIFLSADVFNLYVGLELVGLAAVPLVALPGDAVALGAAMRYLLVALLGSLAYLLGVALTYAAWGTLDLAMLGRVSEPGPVAWAALGFMTAGLGLKTALFPLHFWLPSAHSSAPAPVSALLSAVVVKASFVLVLRLWFVAFRVPASEAAAWFVGALGGAAIVWGSLQALRQARLKLLIAYSTIAQIGYLFLVIPLARGGGDAPRWALEGGVYYAVVHALAKAAMFLVAGIVMHGLGHDRIAGLSGLAARQPLTVFSLAIAGLTLVGLPPSGGFVGKWLLLEASLQRGDWGWVAVILVGGLIAAGYLFAVLRRAFEPAPADATFTPVPWTMQATAFALALLSLALGLWANPLLALIDVGWPPRG